MAVGYDNAAWFYDGLSRMVLGGAPFKAQCYFLKKIPAGSRVLIAGGGTGKVLEALSAIHSAGLDIVYAELSPKMMRRARQRHTGSNHVNFVQLPVQELNVAPFDVIITPFLLDSIPPGEFQNVFLHLATLLKPGGLWLNTDFQLTGKWWQKPLLKTMYFFFTLMGCLTMDDLPAIAQAFNGNGFSVRYEKLFYGDFITAQVWAK